MLKEPQSKLSATASLLKYDAVKVPLNKVRWQGSRYYCNAQRI